MYKQFFNELPLNFLPVSFRIIGFGEKTHNIINQIKTKNYSGVEASLYGSTALYPEEHDQMVILINPSQKDLTSLAKSFYQAGVLTLVISSIDYSNIVNCFDSCTKVPQSKMIPTILGILDPLFHFGPISFDFNDINLTLKDSGKFFVYSFLSDTSQNHIINLTHEISQEFKELDFQNLSFILSYNNESPKTLQMSEIENFQDCIKSFPENVKIIWGVQNEENLKYNQIKVTTILSGSNLKF